MKPSLVLRAALCALPLLAATAGAQSWRRPATTLGTTPRVLVVGARPEDEDNALIAWLSLGRNVETAYLSVTRGESGVNVAGPEKQSSLAVVRTAELLAERDRDHAHQYFTRAYDFGGTTSDSLLGVMWPHDSLVRDVVAIVRAYRPHVIVAMTSADTSEHDLTRRMAAQLAREAFDLAPDVQRLPSLATMRMPAWTPLRFFTRVDSGASAGNIARVDVGEFDRESGRSYAELGAEIRKLQRTQPAPPAPSVGMRIHAFRLDTSRVGSDVSGLFAGIDTSWSSLALARPPAARAPFDSLTVTLASLRAQAHTASADSLAAGYARAAKYSIDARLALPCSDIVGIPSCGGALGDFAIVMETIHRRAIDAFLDASGIVVDGTVARDIVARGDSVAVGVRVFNGSTLPITIRKITATSRSATSPLAGDSIVLLPDSARVWSGNLRVNAMATHWWQVNGMQVGTALHALGSVRGSPVSQMLDGEDRIPQSGVETTLAFAGVDVPFVAGPLTFRGRGTLRGDARHPLAGVTPVSVLLEKTAEYERANLPIDRLFRVYLESARSTAETLSVDLRLPAGLRVDSASRQVVLPPFSARNVFFRIHGKMPVISDSIHASAQHVVSIGPRSGAPTPFGTSSYKYGSVTREYPHIPTQAYIRSSDERIESVDVRVPPRLNVAYVKGTDDVQTPLGQLQIHGQPLDASLLPVVDLSYYSTILIGAGAMEGDALAGAIPSLVDFMKKGGTIVVMPGGDEIARSGLLPFPILFDSVPQRIRNPETPVRIVDRTSQLFSWPNAIALKDFDGWNVERARSVPVGFDSHYRTPLAVGDPDQSPNLATLLMTRVGKGALVYSALSLDRELLAVTPGAARIFINMLSAGMLPGSAKNP
jgi:LmbE family N-acetylglucosaminyl deacetylase